MPMIVSFFLFWLGLEFLFYKMTYFAIEIGLPSDHSFFYFIKQNRALAHTTIFCLFIPSLFFYILWSIVYSNRIAGPLYRFHQHFLTLNSKQEKFSLPLKFRNGDYFLEIADVINQYFEKNK